MKEEKTKVVEDSLFQQVVISGLKVSLGRHSLVLLQNGVISGVPQIPDKPIKKISTSPSR